MQFIAAAHKHFKNMYIALLEKRRLYRLKHRLFPCYNVCQYLGFYFILVFFNMSMIYIGKFLEIVMRVRSRILRSNGVFLEPHPSIVDHHHHHHQSSDENDLMIEILTRLPLKDLLRYKSVSNQWLSLISSPYFSHKHFLRSPNSKVSGIFLSDSSLVDYVPINHHDLASAKALSLMFNNISGIEILGSCFGLLLCRLELSLYSARFTYAVCNPTTSQCKILPILDSISNANVLGIYLSFEPSKSPHYLVILLHRGEDLAEDLFRFEIYHSETNSWRNGDRLFTTHAIDFEHGVYWEGAIHFLGRMNNDTHYFDVERECLGTMPMPSSSPPSSSYDDFNANECLYFGESQGHVHIVEAAAVHATWLDVFEMQRDRSGWFLKCSLNLDDVGFAILDLVEYNFVPQHLRLDRFSVVSVVRMEDEEREEEEEEEEEEVEEEEDGGDGDDDEADIIMLVIALRGKAIAYNLKTKAMFQLCDLETELIGGTCLYKWFQGHQYIETLSAV